MTPLIRITIAWIIGLALVRWLDLPWQIAALIAFPAVGTLLLYRQNAQVRLWAVLALALCAGAFRLQFFQPTIDETHVAFYNDSTGPVTITGVVVDEPDVRDYYLNLRLQSESIQIGDVSQPVEGLVLVRAPRYPERFYGERLTVTGQLETPPVFEDFSYRDYLARFGIHSMIRRPEIELVESDQGNPFWAAMLTFKETASLTINRILAEPYASLLNGILLGIETGIPRAWDESKTLYPSSNIPSISIFPFA